MPSQSHSHQFRQHRLASAQLYLCTDARREHGDLLEFADAALSGGVDIIQLRDKDSAGAKQFGPLEAEEELKLLTGLKELTKKHGALLAVNDRADIAALAGADILHLGQGDLSTTAARQIVGSAMLIGRSTHSQSQAKLADADVELNYFCLGPIWGTPTKPGRPGVGVAELAALETPNLPWFAIGGIDAQRLPEITAHGVARAVVVRAITTASNPETAARDLKIQLARSITEA